MVSEMMVGCKGVSTIYALLTSNLLGITRAMYNTGNGLSRFLQVVTGQVTKGHVSSKLSLWDI